MFSNIHRLSAAVAAGLFLMMTPSPLAAQEKSMNMKPLEIGTRLELFVDDHLVERMTGVAFRLHAPVKQAPAKSPLPYGAYGTIIKDGGLYRAYYRSDIPGYEVGRQTRNADNEPNEITCYAESRDGIEWTFPDLGITKIQSSKGGNVILARQVPFTHNFTPFLDTRPGVGPDARYKALAGSGGTGLVAFKSADGIHWSKIQDGPVIKTPSSAPGTPWPFDSPSPAFWSEAENCYVCFVRTWGQTEPPQTDPDKQFQRRVSRTTSADFITWTPLADTGANLPLEQLYTSQTHPYFRAPHIYIATIMRFTQGIERGEPVTGNNGSSDIVLMTMRAGSTAYQRTFREAFIRPGLDPQRWARKANSAWLNVVPTGDAEMSLYHVNGDRYTLRTDGFISVNAGADGGEVLTKPLTLAGNAAQAREHVLAYLKARGRGSYLFGQVATWVHRENPDMDDPSNWIKKVQDHTGQRPGYGCITYSFAQYPDPSSDAAVNEGVKKMWDRGMIVGIYSFFANPGGGAWNAPVDFENIWAPGENAIKSNFYRQLDRMAANLQWLKDRGIPVVYTPFVESDDGNKWHAKKGSEPVIRLYRLVHDYFQTTKKLDNIIWAYHTTQYNNALERYYPGDEFVDVIGRSAYGQGLPFDEYKWAVEKKQKAGKVIWWAELGLRDPTDAPRDCFDVLRKLEQSFPELAGFVFWSEAPGEARHNVVGNLNGREFMAHSQIVTLDVAHRGELLTKPLLFAGDALLVNFSTGAAGALRVELQDAAGQALPGFGLEDCQAVIGDAIERQVRWKNNPDLAAIAGKPVRLRFAMRECDLYSFRFRSK
jgi:hypothetical protein